MVAKLNAKVRRGGTILMAILGFFLVFFVSNRTTSSTGTVFGNVARADAAPGNCAAYDCWAGPGCCGSCGDGSSSDCGGGGACGT